MTIALNETKLFTANRYMYERFHGSAKVVTSVKTIDKVKL